MKLWGYPIETILAEKMETILSRGVLTTRPRDFYDIYILVKTQKYDKDVFLEALNATSIHRGTYDEIQNAKSIMNEIDNDEVLLKLWKKYQNQFSYARNITFQDTIKTLKILLED